MRLFIAFTIEPDVTRRLGDIISDFRKQGGPIKWVQPDNMHLTARFLGETADTKIDALKKIIENSARQATPIRSVIQQIGGFPNMHRPRVIWAGLDSEANKLTTIASEIERAVQQIGFAAEPKPFKPHLTLGRVREDSRIGNSLDHLLHYKFAPIPLTFERLALIKSTLTPTGPIYDILHEVRFGA